MQTYVSAEKCYFFVLFSIHLHVGFCFILLLFFFFPQCILVESRIIIRLDHFHVNNLCLRIV